MYPGRRHKSRVQLRRAASLSSAFCLLAGVCLGNALAGHSGARATTSFHELMAEAMAVMKRSMEQTPMTGDADRDFAAVMIPHHQGAIDMARAELLGGKDPVLRRIAQEIIVTQLQEIVVMRRRLERIRRSLQPRDVR